MLVEACLDRQATMRRAERYHLAYAADALALGMPNVFMAYVAWIGDFLERRAVSRGHLDESIAALRAAVTAELGVVLP